MCRDIDSYLNLIIEALGQMEHSYFKLQTMHKPIVRERVFCYEFYHKIRCLQEQSNKTELMLNGEIDKRGNESFKKENPDFVFHAPESNKVNTLVVEVKGKLDNRAKRGIIKDFKTISNLMKYNHYKKGVFILYNHSMVDFIDKIIPLLKDELLKDQSLKDQPLKRQLPNLEENKNNIIILCRKYPETKTETETEVERKTLSELFVTPPTTACRMNE